jgi:hypothetical protein
VAAFRNDARAVVPLEVDVRQDAIERPRDACEIECLHQEHGVPLLAVPHEAVQLFLERSGAVRRLLLVSPERAQLALLLEHAFHSIRSYCPRQLVLEVARAGVEPDALELAAVVAPQRAQEVPFLPDVVEARNSDVAVLPEEPRQVAVAAHRHDGDALGLEVAAVATRKRLDGAAVARTLNEHHSARLHTCIRSGRRQAAALPCASVHECTLSRVSEEAARAASSALAMVDTAERLLDRDLEASDDAGVAASRE